LNLELDEDQRAIVNAVESLLARHSGPARAIELAQKAEYDHDLDAALVSAGFDSAMDPETKEGALEATLIVEAVARGAGVTSLPASALIAPAVAGRALPGPVAVGSGDPTAPIRFGAQARTLLWLRKGPEEGLQERCEDGMDRATGGDARIATLEAGDAEPVASNFGYPFGRIAPTVIERSDSLGPESGGLLRNWWRLALAAEAVGTMSAALEQTVAYLKERRQFGRAIASFQAVQHRLALCAVRVEGSRWLVYEAAYKHAPEEATACAAGYALESARQLFRETHQLSGAIGFTREHDLHVWSMRLHALAIELAGPAGHRRAVAAARWGTT